MPFTSTDSRARLPMFSLHRRIVVLHPKYIRGIRKLRKRQHQYPEFGRTQDEVQRLLQALLLMHVYRRFPPHHRRVVLHPTLSLVRRAVRLKIKQQNSTLAFKQGGVWGGGGSENHQN
jgi:hypothetical protein